MQVTGIKNFDNYCYIISVFQILFRLGHFRETLQLCKQIKSTNQNEELISAMSYSANALTQRNFKSITIGRLVDEIQRLNKILKSGQHDAPEFMLWIIKRVHEFHKDVSWNQQSKYVKSLIQNIV